VRDAVSSLASAPDPTTSYTLNIKEDDAMRWLMLVAGMMGCSTSYDGVYVIDEVSESSCTFVPRVGYDLFVHPDCRARQLDDPSIECNGGGDAVLIANTNLPMVPVQCSLPDEAGSFECSTAGSRYDGSYDAVMHGQLTENPRQVTLSYELDVDGQPCGWDLTATWDTQSRNLSPVGLIVP
jgi:hypothetical protein